MKMTEKIESYWQYSAMHHLGGPQLRAMTVMFIAHAVTDAETG